MENELEEGSGTLAEKIIEQYTGQVADEASALVTVLCSIAISLKKMAYEAETATSNMNVGQMK